MTGASAFSANAQEIVRLANRSSGSLEDLQKLIQADPSLVALLLRRVNSAYYHLDQHVQELTVAARLLGFREFRNLAITVYLSRMFEMSDGCRVLSRSRPVESLRGGGRRVPPGVPRVRLRSSGRRVCRRIAARHWLPADHRHVRRRFTQVVDRVGKRGAHPDEERAAYGFDHAQLGERIWLGSGTSPPPWSDAIQFHHDVDVYTGPHREFVCVVAATDYLCSRAGWTSLGVHNLPLPPDIVYRTLGLDQVALAIIWEELLPTLEKATSLAAV